MLFILQIQIQKGLIRFDIQSMSKRLHINQFYSYPYRKQFTDINLAPFLANIDATCKDSGGGMIISTTTTQSVGIEHDNNLNKGKLPTPIMMMAKI